ncbi:MAG TPA: hypothetical protein VG900_18570 [Hyphomicrobiaceae bacterium]|jgi:hypothetical protein|nr:hypothetical protein [Hyphomicrobiaceae bacterium]
MRAAVLKAARAVAGPLAASALAVFALASAADAQQAPRLQTDDPGAALPSIPTDRILPNTTVVPRTSVEPKTPAAAAPGAGGIRLSAALTSDGQSIEQGLVWRVFRDKPGPDGKYKPILTQREANPTVHLEPGTYIVNVAYGRAHLTRRITVPGDHGEERFVLNAGGLRVTPVFSRGDAAPDKSVSYDIYSDERDQHGEKIKVVGDVKTGIIVRLNAGIYSIVSTYGDANAVARADFTVEAGKLTEVTLSHAAARVTFKLVARPGGDALADTQWTLATAQGEMIKRSVGALPTHILAPGSYTVTARHAGQAYQRNFSVQAGQSAQVEVVMP